MTCHGVPTDVICGGRVALDEDGVSGGGGWGVYGRFGSPMVKARVPAPRFHFSHLILPSYDYDMLVEGLLLANLSLVTLLSSGQGSQF